MKSYLSVLIFLLLTLISNITAQNNSVLARYPDLNYDGSKIAFSFQGDVWISSSDGKNLKRLTIHEAYESNPIWSYDDNSIAFSSNRFGNMDIFTIPSKGGLPKRLTFHSANDVLTDFTINNELIFTTARTFKQVEWDSEFAIVPAAGGTPTLLLDALGAAPVKSPDGRFIAFAKGWGRTTREAYRGSANYDIWIYNILNKSYIKLTNFEGHDISPKWADSRTLYFVSAKNGTYNIYKTGIDENGKKSEKIKQVTNYTDDGVRYFNISGDGNSIVFERQTNIYFMNLINREIKKVNINISSDYRFDPIVHKTFSDKMTEYQISPNGKYTALVIRGEIFLTENNKDKKRTINLTNNPYRDQQITWLNDSALVFISDRNGQQDIYLISSADKKETILFKSLKHKIIQLTDTPEDESFPIISPDQTKIVYEIGRGKLIVADITKDGQLNNKTILLDGWAIPGNVSWSPDSKWIAYSLDDLNFNQEIFIRPVDKHIAPVNISMHPRRDSNPVWSNDGSKLGFVSQRNNNDADIWFVWLTKEDWEKTKVDWEETEKPKDDKKNKKNKKDKKDIEVKPIQIDVDNIYERLVQVTSLAGDEGNIRFSKDGEKIYFTSKTPVNKGRDIFSINWDGKDIKSLTKDGGNPGNLQLSSDGKYLFFAQKGKLNRLDLNKDKKESLPFTAKMDINFPAEKEQKFEEGWRALRDGFYDPHFHGNNWNSLKLKYKPWCLSASTTQDFQDMYNLMLGELNASHMGMRGGKPREDTQKEKTGLLGIRITPIEKGVKVDHVITKSPANKDQSRIKTGDIIISVNGRKIDTKTNFYSLLTNTPEEKLFLTVLRNGEEKEIIIRPASSLRNELYDEWVENNRKLVDKYSKGKLGYLHIRAMGWESFERFEREFTARGYGKEGIVIDVRFNGGGWTTDYLMLVLNYKQHAYTIPRGAAENLQMEKENFREYYPLGERLPYYAWTKPSIALCNQNSYSNAEIFSHAYKNLGIGKLVGVPTFGAVISTGARMLIDGSLVRMPFRGWFVKKDNTNMDFVPAVPDIIIENPPNAKATGNDEQLKRAVLELLKEVE